MEVIYCDNCGSQIARDAFSGERAHAEDGRIYCLKCAPLFKHTTTSLMSISSPGVASDKIPVSEMVTGDYPPVATKFYFCETCGKRISDVDIQRGDGKNKKLKGYFCKDCAFGVATIEFEAVNEIPGRAPAKPHHNEIPSRASAKQHRKVADRSIRAPKILGGVVATIIIALALFIASRGSSRTESRAPAAMPELAHSFVRAPQERKEDPAPASEKRPMGLGTPGEANLEPTERADYEKMLKQVSAMEPDDGNRLAIIDAFLKEHGNSALAQSARELRDGVVAMDTFKKSHLFSSPAFEAEAVNALDRLLEGDGAVGNNGFRIAAIESYLQKYGDTIAAARARIVLAELKSVPTPVQNSEAKDLATVPPAAEPQDQKSLVNDIVPAKASPDIKPPEVKAVEIAPIITTPATAVLLPLNVPTNYKVSAINSPTNFSTNNLPPGLSVNAKTGAISGTPTSLGQYSVTVTASNSVGKATATLQVEVLGSVLEEGQSLAVGSRLMSPNGRYVFNHQPDGNLVLQELSTLKVIWSPGTHGNRTSMLILQSNSCLVLYGDDRKKAVWCVGPYRKGHLRLILEDTGKLVLSSINGGAEVWSIGPSKN